MAVDFYLLVALCAVTLPIAGMLILRETRGAFAVVICAAVFVRLMINIANQWVGIFTPKLAGDLSVSIFESAHAGLGLHWWSTFLVQALLAWPFMSVEASLRSVILANNVFSLLFLFSAVALVKPLVSRRECFWLLALALFFPVILNFSMFGLRDPLIYGLVFVYAAALLRLSVRPRAIFWLPVILAAALLASLRIELLIILLILPGLTTWRWMSRAASAGGDVSGSARAARRMLALLLVIGLTLPALYVAGVSGVSDLTPGGVSVDSVQDAVTSRYERQNGGAGGGSSIYGGNLQSMPMVLRVSLSFVGMFLLPFPWTIRDPAQLAAFAESCFLIGLIFWCLTGTRRRECLSTESRDMLIVFFAGTFIIAFFMINFGNAYRMRMAVLPFFFLAFTLILGRARAMRYASSKSAALPNSTWSATRFG